MDGSRLSTLARGLVAAATAGLALLFVGAGATTALAASTPTAKSTATAKATPTPKAAATPKPTPSPKATPTPKSSAPVTRLPAPVTCGNPGKSGKDKGDEDEDSDRDSDKDSEDDDSDVKDAAVVTCPVPIALPAPPVAAAPPTTSGGVAGVTATKAPAAKAVATPKTGAELPLGGALVLVLLGGGALVAGRRLARGARI
ncbi:MAG TPA: hypothetical protein VF112_09550 [Candidatus Dormibacteraeota bacterium]